MLQKMYFQHSVKTIELVIGQLNNMKWDVILKLHKLKFKFVKYVCLMQHLKKCLAFKTCFKLN